MLRAERAEATRPRSDYEKEATRVLRALTTADERVRGAVAADWNSCKSTEDDSQNSSVHSVLSCAANQGECKCSSPTL